MRLRRLFGWGLLAVTLIAMSGCCCSQEELARRKAENLAKKNAPLEVVEKWHKKMAKVAGAVPDVKSLEAKKCPDKRIAKAIKKTKGFTGRLRRGELEYLRWLTSGGDGEEPSTWSWLGTVIRVLPLSEINSEKASASAQLQRAKSSARKAKEFNKKAPYMAVIVRTSGQMPEVTGEETYDAGFLNAWIVVMDVKEQKPVCHAPFSAKSSAKIWFREGRIASGKYKFKKAVQEDFEDNVEKAAREALKSISGKVKVTWGIF